MALREELQLGRPVIGAVVMLPSVAVMDVLCRLDIDFVFIDGQHQGFNPETLADMIRVGDHSGVASIVRVEVGGYAQAELALDLGARGVVFPMVSSIADAEAAVDACRYPPAGRRSVGGLRSMVGADADDVADPLCIVQIEELETVKRASEILAVEGVDAVFPGPVDLAASSGELGTYAEFGRLAALVEPSVREVEIVASRLGVEQMRHCADVPAVQQAVANGARILTVAIDVGVLFGATRSLVDSARAAVGEALRSAPAGG
jgi:4-hydroxy-2-oxoheptanedioate aldolase